MPATATTAERANRYAGKCGTCQGWVPAAKGRLTGKPGAWVIRHAGECPAPPPESSPDPVTEPGAYAHPVTGEIYVVRMGKQSHRPYALRLTEFGGDRLMLSGEHRSIRTDHAPGIIRELTARLRLSTEQGARLAEITRACVRCGRTLRDGGSVEAAAVNGGYGPDCVNKKGW
jgi:hypothetical protein